MTVMNFKYPVTLFTKLFLLCSIQKRNATEAWYWIVQSVIDTPLQFHIFMVVRLVPKFPFFPSPTADLEPQPQLSNV